jgi:hypothetical protein
LLIGVKRALSSSLSSRGSSSCFGDNGRKTHRGLRPLCHHLHGITGLSCYLAQDDIPEVTNGDDISICTTEEMEKYESLRYRKFAHTHIYDVDLLERVVLDEELPTIL